MERARYLQAMGLTSPIYAMDSDTEGVAPSDDITSLGIEALGERVRDCTLCPLAASRTRTVFGVGDTKARIMVVGEAPGRDEDMQGEPFVGRAGKLLNAMLGAIGLSRDAVYIANVIKCRPPNNRDPSPKEVEACFSYLHRQIAIVEPKVLLAVGRIAAQHLLGKEEPMYALRGKVHEKVLGSTPMIVTYHPAYLLRRPSEKKKAWDDLLLLKDTAYADQP